MIRHFNHDAAAYPLIDDGDAKNSAKLQRCSYKVNARSCACPERAEANLQCVNEADDEESKQGAHLKLK
jgi:hypothetical protein